MSVGGPHIDAYHAYQTEQSKSADAQDPAALFALAKKMAGAPNWEVQEAARAVFSRLLSESLEEYEVDAHYYLAIIHRERGELAEARRYLLLGLQSCDKHSLPDGDWQRDQFEREKRSLEQNVERNGMIGLLWIAGAVVVVAVVLRLARRGLAR